MRHALPALLTLLSLTSVARAQTYHAVVLPLAPGQGVTKGAGAGDGLSAGYGVQPGDAFPSNARAVLFRGPTFLDITPAGFRGALVGDSFGRQTVGTATTLDGTTSHAFLWRGVVPTDLHPPTYTGSEALGVGGGAQVGYVWLAGQTFAARWQGTAASMQLLDATGYGDSRAEGTDGVQHVGSAQALPSSWRHALLWNGIAPPIDLHPPGAYVDSIATAIDGGQQVGWARGTATVDEEHAALWLGSANTFHDLNPNGYVRSFVHSVRAGVQVGRGTLPSNPFQTRAVAWRGDALSAQDLHALLPPEFQSGSSVAEDVNARGDIVGWAAQAGGPSHAVLWVH